MFAIHVTVTIVIISQYNYFYMKLESGFVINNYQDSPFSGKYLTLIYFTKISQRSYDLDEIPNF